MSTIRVMQYNVFLRRPMPYNANLYDGQPERASNIPLALDHHESKVDIIVLNEVFSNDRTILEALRPVWAHQTRRLSSGWKIESGGVFIVSKTPILEEDEFIFTAGKHWDFLAAKGVKYIKTLVDSTIVHVFGTHLQATYDLEYETYGRVREQQLQELKKFIMKKEISDKDLVVVAGDFNVDYGKKEYKTVCNILNTIPFDHIRNINSVDKNNQLHGLSHEAKQNGCYDSYKKTHSCSCCQNSLIDYVFVVDGHKNPRHLSLDVWSEFKPTTTLCSRLYGRLRRRPDDWCPTQL